DPAQIEDVVVGCGLPEGATGHNVARNAALEAGFGETVPGMTINRYCGSGLSAASIVANRIAAGEATVAIAAAVQRTTPPRITPPARAPSPGAVVPARGCSSACRRSGGR